VSSEDSDEEQRRQAAEEVCAAAREVIVLWSEGESISPVYFDRLSGALAHWEACGRRQKYSLALTDTGYPPFAILSCDTEQSSITGNYLWTP
jgi:hypothetical protein